MSGAAAALFSAGGRHVLSEGAKVAVRATAEAGANKMLGGGARGIVSFVAKRLSGGAVRGALGEAAGAAAASSAKELAKSTTREVAKAAGKQVFRGVGRAAGLGFVLDGAIAGVEAVVAYRAGTVSREQAAKHVAKEATTGALATGAGVLLGAGLVALTGPVSVPTLVVVGAAGSLGAKSLFRRILR